MLPQNRGQPMAWCWSGSLEKARPVLWPAEAGRAACPSPTGWGGAGSPNRGRPTKAGGLPLPITAQALGKADLVEVVDARGEAGPGLAAHMLPILPAKPGKHPWVRGRC